MYAVYSYITESIAGIFLLVNLSFISSYIYTRRLSGQAVCDPDVALEFVR